MKIMYITPISFNSYNIKRNNFSNTAFRAAIDKNNPTYKELMNTRFKLQNDSVNLINNGENILGKAFIKESKYRIESVITDEECKNILGRADASLKGDSVETCIYNYYKGQIKHVGTEAYNNLFNYIRKNHPEIKKVKANVITEESFKFHTAYGFKIGNENLEFNNIKSFMSKYMEYPLR